MPHLPDVNFNLSLNLAPCLSSMTALHNLSTCRQLIGIWAHCTRPTRPWTQRFRTDLAWLVLLLSSYDGVFWRTGTYHCSFASSCLARWSCPSSILQQVPGIPLRVGSWNASELPLAEWSKRCWDQLCAFNQLPAFFHKQVFLSQGCVLQLNDCSTPKGCTTMAQPFCSSWPTKRMPSNRFPG